MNKTSLSSAILYCNLNLKKPNLETLSYHVNADIGVQGQHFINTDSNGKIQHFPELRFTPLSGPVRTDIAVRQLKCVDDYYIALTDDGLIYCFGKGSLLPEPLLQFTQYSALQHKKIIEFYIGSFLALFITDERQAITWTEKECKMDPILTKHLAETNITKIVCYEQVYVLTEKGDVYAYSVNNGTWTKKPYNTFIIDICMAGENLMAINIDHEIRVGTRHGLFENELPELHFDKLYSASNMLLALSDTTLYCYKANVRWGYSPPVLLYAIDIERREKILNITSTYNRVFILLGTELVFDFEDPTFSDIDIKHV